MFHFGSTLSAIPIDRESRKQALEHMEWIYKSATKVLVLDCRLFEVSAQGMYSEEISLRVLCSAWARRLWTVQEGSFQCHVYYNFKDALHTYVGLNKKFQKHA